MGTHYQRAKNNCAVIYGRSKNSKNSIGFKLNTLFDRIEIMDKSQTPFASAYLRFLQLAKVVQALPDGQEMDANEQALLESVVLCWYENNPMTVREAISLAALGSPATLHKRITRLREKDMLSTLNIEGDRRAKFLIPTQRTLDFFQNLGQSMQQANTNQPA